MVRNAPMWMSDSSSPMMNSMPRQIRISCRSAKNAPTANENSNLTVMYIMTAKSPNTRA